MDANRVAALRWVAVVAVIGGGALGIRELYEEPEILTPPVICRVPVVTPIPTPLPEPEPPPVCPCGITGDRITIDQQRTLELACRMYSDEQCRYPFDVFATPTQGDLTVVIVARSTGECGGCGSLTIAAMFDHHELAAIGELGRFGRFGNGPDDARLISIAGDPAIELAWSEAAGGYSSERRSVFTRDGDGFKEGICIETAWDDRGARDKPTAWKASLTYAGDGGIDVRYTSLERGEVKPLLEPVTIGFDRQARLWIHDRPVDSCVTPQRPDQFDL